MKILKRRTAGHKYISYRDGGASEHKFITYLNTIVQQPDFNKEIQRLREKYNVPIGGYEDYFNESNDPDDEDSMILLPPQVDTMEFVCDAIETLKNYALPSDWFSVIQSLVAYDEFDDLEYSAEINKIVDGIEYETLLSDPASIQSRHIGLKVLVEENPVMILINPYVSERDIIDFIKKNYKLKIKPIQDKYKDPKVKIGKTKKKNKEVKSIEDFVYENRDMKIQKLVGAVSEKFGKVYGYTHIQKIKKAEIARRNSPQKTVLG